MRFFIASFFLSFVIVVFGLSGAAARVAPVKLEAKAEAGDGRAQLELALRACDTRAGVYKSDPSVALKWWKRAAAQHDKSVALDAHQQLGEYYLAQYAFDSYFLKDGEKTRPPGEYKTVAKCRGERPVKPDFKRAEYHFKKCAKGGGNVDFTFVPPATCRHGLGNVNYLQGDYADAFFWYLSVTALINLFEHPDIQKWLEDMKDYRGLMPKVKGSRDVDYARFAAEHLTEEQRMAVFKRVRAYLSRHLPR
jgi:hypothetical protein